MTENRNIISSKDILSTQYLEVDSMIIRYSDMMYRSKEGMSKPMRKAYMNAIKQLRSILLYDINKQPEEDQSKFKIPFKDDRDSLPDWEVLHTELRLLARAIGIVGREKMNFGSPSAIRSEDAQKEIHKALRGLSELQ